MRREVHVWHPVARHPDHADDAVGGLSVADGDVQPREGSHHATAYGLLTMRVAFVVAGLLSVAGCATGIVDAARPGPTSERSDLAPQAGGGGGGGM